MSETTRLCENLERLDTYAAELLAKVGEHPGTCECSPCVAYRLVSDAAGRAARRLEQHLAEQDWCREYEKP